MLMSFARSEEAFAVMVVLNGPDEPNLPAFLLVAARDEHCVEGVRRREVAAERRIEIREKPRGETSPLLKVLLVISGFHPLTDDGVRRLLPGNPVRAFRKSDDTKDPAPSETAV